MEFKNCIVGKEVFGEDAKKKYDADGSKPASVVLDNPKTDKTDKNPEDDGTVAKAGKFNDETLKAYFDAKLDKPQFFELKNQKMDKAQLQFNTQRQLIMEFWQLLTLCHECVLEHNEKTGEFTYQSSSPDEVALVQTAREQGFIYKGTVNGVAQAIVLGQEKTWEVLRTFEFNSNRKRMTVVVREGNLIKMYTKGADNILKARLKTNADQPFLPFIDEKLKYFSNLGLRTLLYGVRIMEEGEYLEMDRRLNELIEVENRDDKMLDVAADYEKDYYLLGATAVEDKLQQNVPQVIHDLLTANIKVWMLTGDKLETAENIAYSCRLFTGEMNVMRLAEWDKSKIHEKMKLNHEIQEECIKNNRKMAFIIEGESLAMMIGDVALEKMFLDLSGKCEAVVCCRATPKQKADVVRLIKKYTGKITLAIGDGNNDVNMIQEANIGIGLYGNEGMRAVQASDYALGEFQGLWRLLLVHGRWCYIRIAEMIIYFFYKNMLFTLPQFYFAFRNGFSAQTIYDDWYWSFYNMIFTALPLVIKAIWEQDINYKMRIRDYNKTVDEKKERSFVYATKNIMPHIYDVGQENKIFRIWRFIFNLLSGWLQALMIFLFLMYILPESVLGSKGYNSDLWYYSITMYTAVIFIVDTKLAIQTRYWTWMNAVAMLLLSIGIYILYQWVYDGLSFAKCQYTISVMYSTSYYWLIFIICWGICFIYEMLFVLLEKHYRQDLADTLRYLLNYDFDAYLGVVYSVLNEAPEHESKSPRHPEDIRHDPQSLEMQSLRVINHTQGIYQKEEAESMNPPAYPFKATMGGHHDEEPGLDHTIN
jgi:phospholipid-transporting ATPase